MLITTSFNFSQFDQELLSTGTVARLLAALKASDAADEVVASRDVDAE